jgi:hypothetical protein
VPVVQLISPYGNTALTGFFLIRIVFVVLVQMLYFLVKAARKISTDPDNLHRLRIGRCVRSLYPLAAQTPSTMPCMHIYM